MGGEKFDTPQPEAYLFGENADLNFLGNKPTPFPYPPPQSNEPYKTLKALINIRKESLRFVKANTDSAQQTYNIEFVFDCDVPCSITIHFFVTEDTTNNTVSYIPKNVNTAPCPKTFHFKKGASQLFSQPSVTFTPSLYEDGELAYNMDKEIIPIAIHCVTLSDDGTEDMKQSHTSIAVVDHHADGCYTLKGLKQKLYVDGLCYLLQEIYGIENKNNETYKGCEDCEDGGSECVICMCDIRDTLILPCRHLCLCYSCADSLRYQANNCPICRAPFRALLQIRALQKNSSHVSETSSDNIPSGYDAVSLIEALNGPCAVRHPPLVVSLDPLGENPDLQTAAQVLNRRASGKHGGGEEKSGAGSVVDAAYSAPEVRMSSLLATQDPVSTDTSPSEETRASPSAPTRKPPLMRDKSLLRPHRAPPQTPLSETDGNETPDEDSEAEKLSPLLDAATSTELDRTQHNSGSDRGEYYSSKPQGTSSTEFYSTKSAPKKDRSPSLNMESEELGEYFGSDMQLQVEIIGSPSSDQITTITQAGCGGCSVDTAASGPTPGPPGVSNNPPSSMLGDESDYYTPEDPGTTILSPVQEAESHPATKPPPSSTTQPASECTPPTLKCNAWNSSLPGTPLSNASHRSSGDSYSSGSSTRLLLTYENSTVP